MLCYGIYKCEPQKHKQQTYIGLRNVCRDALLGPISAARNLISRFDANFYANVALRK